MEPSRLSAASHSWWTYFLVEWNGPTPYVVTSSGCQAALKYFSRNTYLWMWIWLLERQILQLWGLLVFRICQHMAAELLMAGEWRQSSFLLHLPSQVLPFLPVLWPGFDLPSICSPAAIASYHIMDTLLLSLRRLLVWNLLHWPVAITVFPASAVTVTMLPLPVLVGDGLNDTTLKNNSGSWLAVTDLA